MRLQVSLRMFLLLCTGAGLVAAWSGFIWQRRENAEAHEIRYRWRDFGESGRIYISDRHEVRGASVDVRTDLKELAARPDARMSITYLSIQGSETFGAFHPLDFPNVKKLALYAVQPQPGSFHRFGELRQLQFLHVREANTDPLIAFDGLASCLELRQMVLEVGPDTSLLGFPQLDQLRILRIRKPGISEDEVKGLKTRIPSCEVIVDEQS